LINAQEEERTRIARDLHDDVSQQLAGVAIMLSGLKRKIGKPGSEPEIDRTVTTLQDRTSTLAQSVRNLSHELHPSVLQHSGLVPTLRRHCADVEEHYHVNVIFNAGDDLESLRPEVALCLFRVAQEALTNAMRHARAHTIRIELMPTNDGIELCVVDDGIGFAASERRGSGLGLRSMDERVRLARGNVRVESLPGHGTKVLVRIPNPLAATPLEAVQET
jgi:signal transduction histidine kinase